MMTFLLFAPASTKWLGWRKTQKIPKEQLTIGRFCDINCAVILRNSFALRVISIPANSHALSVSLTPAGWKLRSHAGSRLRTNFSRLIGKCELLPSCLTQFPKICWLRPKLLEETGYEKRQISMIKTTVLQFMFKAPWKCTILCFLLANCYGIN